MTAQEAPPAPVVPMQIQYKVLDVECEGQAKQLLHRYWKGHLDAQLSDEAFEGVFGQNPSSVRPLK